MSAKQAWVLMYQNFRRADNAEPGALSVSAAKVQFEYLRRQVQIVPLLDSLSNWLREKA